MQKGAMFGLDARIALVIFGALSVISGAALFSTIKTAKATKYVVELQEFSRAVEAYMLDTGQDLPKVDTRPYMIDAKELLTSTASGWRGPYWTQEYKDESNGFISDMPSFEDGKAILRIDILDDSVSLGGTVSSEVGCTSSSESCHYWVRYGGAKISDLSDKIDEVVDGVVDHADGQIRIYTHSDSNYQHSHIWIRGPKSFGEWD